MDASLKQTPQNSWAICKRGLSFFFLEATVFCMKNWLLVVLSILTTFGLDFLENFIIDYFFIENSIFITKSYFIRIIFSVIYTAAITMILVRYIRYFFNNKLQTTGWGLEWTKRETSTFILLLKYILLYRLVHFTLLSILSPDTYVWFFSGIRIGALLHLCFFIIMAFAVILAVSLNKNPVQIAVSCIIGKFWMIVITPLLFICIVFFPLLVIFETLGSELWMKNNMTLILEIMKFIIFPLFIRFGCALFQGIASESLKKRVMDGMFD